ncbi:DinB family protein [Amycolatopsis sp. GM8]|uniref:DinB family protein n=1 Tax=Amycolatopsis sp. GM8 TaxID=2896530 RepID=UPI001F2B3278|nr:DinB family protein [Amycolatopsis sp. GM8]
MSGNVRPVRDERDGLLAFLAQQRYVLRLTAYGLTDAQARLVPSDSALSIGGLLKHVTSTERGWMNTVLQRPPEGTMEERAGEYLDDFQFTEDDTLPAVIADYELAGRETEEIIAGIADLGQPVPVPKGVPWFPDDIDAWSVRWVLLHLIQETARHAGHADIVREHIDGATAFPLMAAAEDWPATPWMTPWQPTPT